MVDLLECTVMPYAWGSRTAIAQLSGRPSPAPTPEAELWMGAHPMAPSRLARAGSVRALSDVVEGAPAQELGATALAAFGRRLPFLLKVLAAAEPLSLQAHPTELQARAGFDEEERRGVSRDAPTRNYRDPSHKPELLAALTPFDALCGFRAVAESLALFDELAVPELHAVLGPLRRSPDERGLAETFRALMMLDAGEGARVVAATVAACRAHVAGNGGPRFSRERSWAIRLDELYPGDVGVVSALLLNLVHLEPGEAIYLGAGRLHAYLEGVGIEIMASSDNVLRGGLTRKHVDVPELVRVLEFSSGPIAPLRPRALDRSEHVYDTPAREFRLSRIELDGADPVARDVTGPEILLAIGGAAVVHPADGTPAIVLGAGRCVFVAASTGRYHLAASGTSNASLYRASVNLT